MIIGVPKELKNGETRVGILPSGVEALVKSGHQVLIETAAGARCGFSDGDYQHAGATIQPNGKEVWTKCDLLVKVKEPHLNEIPYFREGLIVFSFLHHVTAPEMTTAMLQKKVTGLDYDTLQLDDGRYPILIPMSEIAGKLAIQCGAYALQSGNGGAGVLLGGTEKVSPGRVVVIGAGTVGTHAARTAVGMGARVTVLDDKEAKLARLKSVVPSVETTSTSVSQALAKELSETDIFVGCALVPGDFTPKLITRESLAKMKRGAVIVDVSIDQGGIAETSRATTISEPTFVVDGIVHYCVPNMPALVPQTSVRALTAETINWIKILADNGLERSLESSKPLRKSLTTLNGKMTNEIIAHALGI